MTDINLPLILIAALIATGSPGPAILAIAGTSMSSGRKTGLALASGVSTGSLIWSSAAAFGLGAVMLANSWVFEVVRYLGAGYLLFLAYKSVRSALSSRDLIVKNMTIPSYRSAYRKGLFLHLTNPKAILFLGALFSIGIPPGSAPVNLIIIILAVGIQSTLVFHGYALLFSNKKIRSGYAKMRRWFESLFAAAFGFSGFKILSTELE